MPRNPVLNPDLNPVGAKPLKAQSAVCPYCGATGFIHHQDAPNDFLDEHLADVEARLNVLEASAQKLRALEGRPSSLWPARGASPRG